LGAPIFGEVLNIRIIEVPANQKTCGGESDWKNLKKKDIGLRLGQGLIVLEMDLLGFEAAKEAHHSGIYYNGSPCGFA
jgi:hypothetical protein